MKHNILNHQVQRPNVFSTIAWAGLISGILDGIAAAIFFHARLGLNAGQVMQFVASSFYGPSAFEGGYLTIILGTLFHFLIAFVISAVYFYAYPVIRLLRNWPVTSGAVFGLGVWLVINLLVLPLTKIQLPPFELKGALIAIVWHMLLIGLPIALITNIHYRALTSLNYSGSASHNRFKNRR